MCVYVWRGGGAALKVTPAGNCFRQKLAPMHAPAEPILKLKKILTRDFCIFVGCGVLGFDFKKWKSSIDPYSRDATAFFYMMS